jgi:hypothetical protein
MDEFSGWRWCDEISVLQAIYLLIGKNPSRFSKCMPEDGYNSVPEGFRAVFTALTNAIKQGRLKATIYHNATKDGFCVERDEEWSAYHNKEDDVTSWPPAPPKFYYEDTPNWAETTILVENLKEWLRGRGTKDGFFFSVQESLTTAKVNELDEIKSEELRICNKAYRSLIDQKNWPEKYKGHKGDEPATTLRQAILGWLQINHPDLAKEAIDRIATVTNWDKSGKKYK